MPTILRVLVLLLCTTPLLADDDIADVKSDDLRAGKDEKKRYFLITPPKDAKVPKNGLGLIILMPGGPGTADFLPFVKRIYKHAIPEGYLVVQPVAVKWTDTQEIVWPTDKTRVKEMKFTTEKFVDTIITDVTAKHKVDAERVFTLTWSSSGPAAYAISLTNPKVTGSFIAMSVFKPDTLPDLAKAKGHGYYLYHSPDDRLCPYKMAAEAKAKLAKEGATTTLADYDGGHGWRGPLYDNIKTGIEWLEKNHAKK